MKNIFSIQGIPGPTITIVSGDTAGQISTASFTKNNQLAIAAIITCEGNNIRFTLGDNMPAQGVNGPGHIFYVGQSIRLSNPRAIQEFNFINATNGQAGYMQFTPEFDIGV